MVDGNRKKQALSLTIAECLRSVQRFGQAAELLNSNSRECIPHEISVTERQQTVIKSPDIGIQAGKRSVAIGTSLDMPSHGLQRIQAAAEILVRQFSDERGLLQDLPRLVLVQETFQLHPQQDADNAEGENDDGHPDHQLDIDLSTSGI